MTEMEGLKGFYDRYPDEWASWRALIDTVEETAREFGFNEINAPAVERADLYRVKSGEEMMEQMFNFEDKGGREVSLVPEQTPTRARMVQSRKDLSTPIKWFDTSKRWRYEEVQRGRDREFFQTDFDIIGAESVYADAEVVACAAEIYRKLGVDDRVDFLVNDRRLLESVLESLGVDNTDEVMRQVIDDREKMNREEFVRELADSGLDHGTAEEVAEITDISGPILETLEELEDLAPDGAADSVERMHDLAEALESMGSADMVQLDMSIVRGFAYYTGLVFEAFDAEGELRALFGGGRYDTLIGMFGSDQKAAVGFGFGYSTTMELLREEEMLPLAEPGPDAYVLPVNDEVRTEALDLVRELRSKGLSVETDLKDRNVGNQISYADSSGARHTLILGPEELEDGTVSVKDMVSGEERQVDRTDVLDVLSTD
nr:MAG: histidyl-tRNA synthetase [Candidatus Nanosalinarum sp. J07AB56]